MSHLVRVRDIATRLKFVDEHGHLVPLDSLAIVDLVVELEDAFKIRIPSAYMRVESFSDLETVAKMVEEIERA